MKTYTRERRGITIQNVGLYNRSDIQSYLIFTLKGKYQCWFGFKPRNSRRPCDVLLHIQQPTLGNELLCRWVCAEKWMRSEKKAMFIPSLSSSPLFLLHDPVFSLLCWFSLHVFKARSSQRGRKRVSAIGYGLIQTHLRQQVNRLLQYPFFGKTYI